MSKRFITYIVLVIGTPACLSASEAPPLKRHKPPPLTRTYSVHPARNLPLSTAIVEGNRKLIVQYLYTMPGTLDCQYALLGLNSQTEIKELILSHIQSYWLKKIASSPSDAYETLKKSYATLQQGAHAREVPIDYFFECLIHRLQILAFDTLQKNQKTDLKSSIEDQPTVPELKYLAARVIITRMPQLLKMPYAPDIVDLFTHAQPKIKPQPAIISLVDPLSSSSFEGSQASQPS